jgi:hypothetical protein
VLRVRTQQWRATPLMFVDVRGDLDQPVVLREVQRLTDYLRAQPGVAGAWSVADLFFGVSFTGDDVSRIPDSSELVRRILFQARADPALSLELAPDHHEGLVAIRFDDEAGVSRLDLFDRLALYLRTELRVALLQVDLTAPGLSPVTRSLGKGVLATDARERIVRICERSGRALSDGEVASVEMLARRTAVVPTVDLGRLRREVAAELRDQRIAIARRAGLADELATLGEDATPEDVRRALAARLGPRVRDPELIRKAASLHDWLAVARVRNSARVNFREMLYGADLPSEGLLADEVRAATRDAMGPMAGIPVRAETPGAYHLDAMSVGGAANDQALSVFLPPGIRWGGVLATGIVALLLVASGRGRGLLWLPVGLGPVAVAVIVLSLTRDPVGMAFVSFIAGALSGGVAWVASLAARRAP